MIERKILGTLVTAVALVAAVATASAQDKKVVDNVVSAARKLAETEKAKGLGSAFGEMRACYERELQFSHVFTPPLQVCVAQDMIVSRVVAEFSKTMTADARKANELPEAEVAISAMQERIVGTFQRIRLSPEEAKTFTEIVRVQGMDAYGRARYPERYK
ncbi:hypothetical protein GJW-30_1_01897 [Variibacter gotjawalensis]|uniref:Uncharacterized protein n=1 Tax=Variibacter gotjawalensis TaxID=1333996 RepID=A0A0S3PTS4_9BRAD|nr:hypothetical protein [Variibacter gotjawalensis]NIK49682.1 hypothetical protein [Variibacter gotjawalensis]RZS45694.1 hypothetical protein EV661_4015 [Variibacter gotjawalensis]BAT59365.1 hypothetical protein GJW-30_1_01897 [Variibacter gotjawalensis]